MVHYKLTYFDARVLGEAARQLFHLADVPFEDKRLSVEEFGKLKHTFPSGQVPTLEVDGFEISQSGAINRYLARQFGFAGKTPLEEAQVDSIFDIYKDFLKAFQQYGLRLIKGTPEEELNKIIEEIVKPAAQVYFTAMKSFLEKSKSGFLVGDSLTWADLHIADTLTTLKNIDVFKPSEEPLLNTFHQKILETPKLKKYLENRPITKI